MNNYPSIEDVDMYLSYSALDEVSNQFKESNDCSIKAICVTTGIDYSHVRDVMSKLGRRPRHGAQLNDIYKALNLLGYEVAPYKKPAKTIRTLERVVLPKDKKFLVFTRGHVAGVNKGKVVDWTSGRLHHIKFMKEVVKIESGGED